MELTALQRGELHKLVDKYESRKDYGQPDKHRRRTMLRIDPRGYPKYHHASDGSFRHRYNQDMGVLARSELVELEWERFRVGEILTRVFLVEEALPDLYRLLGRESKQEQYQKLGQLVAQCSDEAPVGLGAFYADLSRTIAELRPLPSKVSQPSLANYEQFFTGLHAFVAPRDQEVLRRRLSVELYRDSKCLDRYLGGFLWVIRQYLRPLGEDLADEELLAEYNIVGHPEHVKLAGPLVIHTSKGAVDSGCFYPDMGLSPQMIGDMQVSRCPVAMVVTVENLASFHHFIQEGPPDHLALYLGGYHSRTRRLILTKLRDFFQAEGRDVPFLHWGDLDLGGFQIWHHLREKTGVAVRPVLMDEKVYGDHLHLGHAFTTSYAEKLAALLLRLEFEPFHAVIARMLETKVRIEQEAIQEIGKYWPQ